LSVRGKVAVVTGASGGIGSVTVHAFARAGAHVVLAAPEGELPRLSALAAEAESLGVRALVVATDVTRRADIDRLVRRTLDAFGTIDVLANVAGIGSCPSLCDSTDEELERVVSVNLLGCARLMHAVLPVMKRQRSGSIVSVGSIAGETGIMGIYSASKFGLRGLCDSVRREVRSYGIGVTLIEPGFVNTQMNPAMDGLPSPEIVARAILAAVARPRRRHIVPKRYRAAVFVFNRLPWFADLVFGNARIQERINRDSRAANASALSRHPELGEKPQHE
jgi:NAD(P)-dependent dehydrogenase (short-subunit alcohol dehydrogenase family)